MLKKSLSYFGVLVLACFSFYYTDKATNIVKRNDPIMKSIMSNSKDYYVEPVSAILNEDEIKPGINGKRVDIDKSYKKMKQLNKYDENVLVFEEVNPNISFINDYDKYIIGGNDLKNNIALVFKIDDISYLKTINNILLEKSVLATFFIDGSIMEDNIDDIVELVNNSYEIENLGYDGKYSLDMFNWTNNLLYSITKTNPKFCYTDYKNTEILELCKKYNMYTVKPTVSINSNYPFITVKNNLANGRIISFNISDQVIKELPSIISYIKQKGYNLVTLNMLINENLVEEK